MTVPTPPLPAAPAGQPAPPAPAAPVPAPAPAPGTATYNVADVHRRQDLPAGQTDTSAVVLVSQDRMAALMAREADQGARTLVRGRYQVDNLEQADQLVALGRAAQAAGWKVEGGQPVPPTAPPAAPAPGQPAGTPTHGLSQADVDAAVARERQTWQATQQHEGALVAALQGGRCSVIPAALPILKERVPAGSDPLRVQAEVQRLATEYPQLFTAPAPVPPGPGQQTGYPVATPGALPATDGFGAGVLPPSQQSTAVPPPQPLTLPGQPGVVPPTPAAAPPAGMDPAQAGGRYGSAGRAEAARRFPPKAPTA